MFRHLTQDNSRPLLIFVDSWHHSILVVDVQLQATDRSLDMQQLLWLGGRSRTNKVRQMYIRSAFICRSLCLWISEPIVLQTVIMYEYTSTHKFAYPRDIVVIANGYWVLTLPRATQLSACKLRNSYPLATRKRIPSTIIYY